MPLISVVIPVYNGEKTIRETIESVLNQSFQDFELIVINDGSQDSTLEIVCSIKDPRLQVFSCSNAGLATSRNRGIARAVGEYISFIDADDLWTPDKLEAQLKALKDNPESAVAYSWTNYIDESSQFLRRGGYLTADGDVYAQLLVINFLENGSNPLIRRQALIDVGGFDESLPAAEDWDIFLRLAARYSFVGVPSPQILYRTSVKSMSANVVRQEAACLKVLERAYNQAPKSLQFLKKYSWANLYRYLSFKVLDGPVDRRKRGLIAAKFLLILITNDMALLKYYSTWQVLLKVVVLSFFHPQKSQKIIDNFPPLSYIQTDLLLHFKTDIRQSKA
jgi:glycosyltransferase involved in cell wall biosynthesis